MAAPSPATLLRLLKEDLRHQNRTLQHSPGKGASAVMVSSPPAGSAAYPGNQSPDAEVIALSPKTIMAKYKFWCEVCYKGFPREQNLQLHRRGHNLPWKLKKKTNHEVIRKKVYVCPEVGCVRHDPSRALADLIAIKKHFSRKHGEKKFSCQRCNKKYAVCSDWKAHNKICGTKEYTCDCGTTFSRYDNFISHRIFCLALAGEVARHTINSSPYSSMGASILANASNPASMSLGSAAGSLIPGNHQQISSPLSVGSAFQTIQPPNIPLPPFSEPKLTYPRSSDSSEIHGFPGYTAVGNMSNFNFNAGPHLNSSQNDLNDLNIHSSFTGLLMGIKNSATNILNSSPFQFSTPTHIQKATMTRVNSNNVAHVNSTGSSLSGTAMKFNNCGGSWGDEMTGGGKGAGSTFQEMYDNLIVGGESTRGVTYNVRNSDGRLVGELNNNVLMEPEMTVQSEYCDKHTRDFPCMENGMNRFTASGMVNDSNGYEIGIGIGTNEPRSEATVSAHASPLFAGCRPGF